MKYFVKFDAASYIIAGEIPNRTNTQNYKQTNKQTDKQTVNDVATLCQIDRMYSIDWCYFQ